jgi:membrane protein
MALQLTSLQDLVHRVRRYTNHLLWNQETEKLPWGIRVLVRSGQIFFAILRDLLQEQLSLRAMSLVFTTVIGFFPLLALAFAVLKGLGVHNAMEPTLQALLEPLGDRSAELTQQILNYVDNIQVELIGITSVALLLYIVLDMMRKIESAFNYIWAVKHARSWSNRVSEYLFAAIVSPLLLFVSISITSYVNTNFFELFLQDLAYGGVVIGITALVAPVLLMSLAFAFAYSFLPNTKVNFSSAFIGGFITAIIWKIMGLVFADIFISSARESIYLAFATIVAIMFFVYIGWLVALIGSSIAYYHQHPAKARTGREKLTQSISQQEQLAMAVASCIIHRFQKHDQRVSVDDLISQLDSHSQAIEIALDTLMKIGLITATADEPARFLPTGSVQDLSLVDIWKTLRQCNSSPLDEGIESEELREIKEFQFQLEAVVEKELGTRKFIESAE